MGTPGIDWTLSFKEIIILTKAFFSEPPIEIDNNQTVNSYDDEQLVSETSLSSDCEMKADAASVNPTKISTNTDSQSPNSGKKNVYTKDHPCFYPQKKALNVL